MTLGEHLDGTVRHVADEAGQLMAAGCPVCGEAKADAVDTANENYTFRYHLSYRILCIAFPN